MIEIKNLTKSYAGRTVVDDLTLTIPKGTVFGFLGQNGAGKTTTVKIAVGLSAPDSGTVTIAGVSAENPASREKIGFAPEAPYFYDRLTGLEFMRFCAELFPRPDPGVGAALTPGSLGRMESILRDVGIYEAKDRAIATYSKGMRQRLGFAQALVNDPECIFLDEPLDGLDPLGRKEIKEIIKKLHAEGKTVFFNSHILYDTEELCDSIGIIHEGKLLYTGPVKEFCAGSPLETRFVELIEAQKHHI